MNTTPATFVEIQPLDSNPKYSGLTLRGLQAYDASALGDYFAQMSSQTRQYYAPHPLSNETAQQLCEPRTLSASPNLRLVVSDSHGLIVGYFVIQFDINPQELQRYQSFGINLTDTPAVSFAPSVSENWIGKGIGSHVFPHIRDYLAGRGIEIIVLMGGVQARNHLAVHYYRKWGFEVTGGYVSDVENIDMALWLG